MEKEIQKIIDELKPEIKKRAVFRFSDELKKEGKGIVFANTAINLNPPVITIFTKTINDSIKRKLREIITHEIIHTFTADERVAYGKQAKLDIFK